MTPALRAVCCAAFLLLLSGCGGSDTPKPGAPGIPPAPVDVLYNHGIDALNAQRYQTAADQFDLGGAELSLFGPGRRTRSSCRATPVSATELHRRDRRARPLHPACTRPAATSPTPTTCARFAITSRSPTSARPEGHAGRHGGAAGSGEPLPRQRLCARRAAEDRPRARPSCRQGNGRSAAGTRTSTCTPPRSAASSAWWTTSRPPTTSPRRCTGWPRSTCGSACVDAGQADRRRARLQLPRQSPGTPTAMTTSYDNKLVQGLPPPTGSGHGLLRAAPSDWLF